LAVTRIKNRAPVDALLVLYRQYIEPLLQADERIIGRSDLHNPLRYSAKRIFTSYRNQIACHFLRLLNKLKKKDPTDGEAAAESVLHDVDISEHGIAYDVVAAPLKFLPALIRLHEQFRVRGWKLFQCMPLSRRNAPQHMTADTTTLRQWVGPNKLSNEELWATFFDSQSAATVHGDSPAQSRRTAWQ
jgi:hypothetical protein